MSADDQWQFVDTNVLVYAFDGAAGARHQAARALLAALWESRAGCLSVQVLQEFHVVVTRKVARPLAPRAAAAIIRDLSTWRVHAPQAVDVVAAIDLQERQQISFRDAMLLHSAVSLGCRLVWSEDLTHGQQFDGVTVQNPFRERGWGRR